MISLGLGVYCFSLPDTPPPVSVGDVLPFVQALRMLAEPDFLVFLIVAFVLATQLQFYFLGTAQYLGDLGVRSKNVPAVMSIAQAAQFVAMLFMAFWQTELLDSIGYRWTFALGVLAWLAMYLAFSTTRTAVVIVSQALHGIAYTLFIGVGYVYVDAVAPKDIAGSAMGLYVVVLFGFGLFAGTQFTGAVMDRFKTPEGKFRWRPIYLVPCAVALACAIAMAALFRG